MEIGDQFEVKTFFFLFLEITMILGQKKGKYKIKALFSF